MKKRLFLMIAGFCFLLIVAPQIRAQKKSKASNVYIGYVYPAGGQQGTTFHVRIGGQRIEGAYDARVSGTGVHAKILECWGRIGNQELRVLREQAKLLKKSKKPEEIKIKKRLNERLKEYEKRPANASIALITIVEITIDKDAQPGKREIRIMTPKGISNPLPFYVGQIQEVTRKPMRISKAQVLGREAAALRKRPETEVEKNIILPCVMNGQVASGEVNRYRFSARKGQKLVISTLARQLIPYIADAVPGWFQPVLTLYDTDGKEVAFNDDFRFKPDPTILYEVPKNGEYVLQINDAIYRGREDFVYRITIGELPFLTSVYPMGSQRGCPVKIKTTGWNLGNTVLKLPAKDSAEGIYYITAGNRRFLSNRVPYMISSLPECFEKENNNDIAHAQDVLMPVMINGGSNRPGDWDVYRVQARAGDTIVAEVYARRLDSPFDSIIKLTDSSGTVLALNDDHADPGSGLNTHHADSYLMTKVKKSDDYYIHITDATYKGGVAYAYRLRISRPRPGFELRTVPSSFHFSKLAKSVPIKNRMSAKTRGKKKKKKKYRSQEISAKPVASTPVTVYAIRKDGYDGPITLRLKNPPKGFSAREVTIKPGSEKASFTIQTSLPKIKDPVPLTLEGYAHISGKEITAIAVPAEDWMQAFLWRHLVPAQELLAHAYSPSAKISKPERKPLELPFANELAAASGGKKGKKSKNSSNLSKEQRQIITRIKQLGKLYEDGLLTNDFYLQKVAEYKTYLEKNK